jgi:2-polyprenyl-3-methyl-5-hydroxy-6-metoxy-1,4-benzoquinol methylase
LKRIPFQLNSNVFHFDTEIIIQLLFAGARIAEHGIPTYYGDEKCHVDGLRYAWDVIRASVAARLQAFNLIYRRNFDIDGARGEGNAHYVSKLGFASTHSYAMAEVGAHETVVDIGCAGGYMTEQLDARGCTVIGIDRHRPSDTAPMRSFFQRDLDRDPLPACVSKADVVLLLDVVEHLRSPERFMDDLHTALSTAPSSRIVLSTGNIGFIVTRLMLLLGQFNYGKRGILDLTHTRLFTFASVQRLLQESGFEIHSVRGVPAPVPEIVQRGWVANALMQLNRLAIRLSRGLFAYQIFIVARPLPTLPSLLRASENHTHDRIRAVAAVASRPHTRERVAVQRAVRRPPSRVS